MKRDLIEGMTNAQQGAAVVIVSVGLLDLTNVPSIHATRF